MKVYARTTACHVTALLLLLKSSCVIVSSFQVTTRSLPVAGIVVPQQVQGPSHLQARSPWTVILQAKKKRRTKRLDSSGTPTQQQQSTPMPTSEPAATQQHAEPISETQSAASQVAPQADSSVKEDTTSKEDTKPVEAAPAIVESANNKETQPVEEVRQGDAPAAEKETESTTSKVVELKPRDRIAVSIPVSDVRDVVAGKVNEPEAPSVPTTGSTSKSPAVESSSEEETKREPAVAVTSSTAGSTDLNDSLQMLLADAKQMKALEESSAAEESGFSVSKSVKSVISTIVTIDFFVVCIFLLWFLAGVFGSYVLKNDSIQIAFNSIFQPVVQPALGILMIAAISDAVFKQKDNEEEN